MSVEQIFDDIYACKNQILSALGQGPNHDFRLGTRTFEKKLIGNIKGNVVLAGGKSKKKTRKRKYKKRKTNKRKLRKKKTKRRKSTRKTKRKRKNYIQIETLIHQNKNENQKMNYIKK